MLKKTQVRHQDQRRMLESIMHCFPSKTRSPTARNQTNVISVKRCGYRGEIHFSFFLFFEHFCFPGEAHTRSVITLLEKIKGLAEGLAVLEVAAADGSEKFLQIPILPDNPP